MTMYERGLLILSEDADVKSDPVKAWYAGITDDSPGWRFSRPLTMELTSVYLLWFPIPVHDNIS